jgi:autotransporter-associated beta strand protein
LTVGAGGIDQSGSGVNTVTVNVISGSSSTWSVASGTLAVSGVISGLVGNSLTKDGAGTLTVSGNNTYLGTTTISAGTFFVDGNQTAATGAVAVNAGTLGGSGSIGGAVTVNSGGTLAPGNSPGILTVGSLMLNTGSMTRIEVNGTAIRGTDFDGINISNFSSLTYGGNLTFSFGSTLANTTIDLFSFTGVPAGNFANVSSTGSYVGAWTFGSGAWSFTDGQQTLSFGLASGDLNVVPEPTTWAFFGLVICLGSILVRLWSRKAA